MKPTGLPRKPRPTHIINVVHDPLTNDLHVTFHNGKTYAYGDVPVEKYQQMMQSKSKGSYLDANIKNKHAYRKIIK
jgi:hypothetical protein